MKKISLLFLLTFIMISCSSDDSSIEEVVVEEEENIPIETRNFVSKIYYNNTDADLDELTYNYNSENNLTSIVKNEETITYLYEGNKIIRAEITNNSTGEITNYINYFYNNDGRLDYYESDLYLYWGVKHKVT